MSTKPTAACEASAYALVSVLQVLADLRRQARIANIGGDAESAVEFTVLAEMTEGLVSDITIRNQSAGATKH